VLFHLFYQLHEFISEDVRREFVMECLQLITTSDSSYLKYTITMMFIHLFARQSLSIITLLVSLPITTDGLSPLKLLLDNWLSLHSKLSSRYNSHISTLALSTLIRHFSTAQSQTQPDNNPNHFLAGKVLHTMLANLPAVLANRDAIDSKLEYEDDFDGVGEGDGEELEEDYEDSDSEEIWDEDINGDDDMEDEDDGEDPFADADILLSDMISKKTTGTRTRNTDVDLDGEEEEGEEEAGNWLSSRKHELMVLVSDHLVFSPPSRDPMVLIDIEGFIIAVLKEQLSFTGTVVQQIVAPWRSCLSDILLFILGSYPGWMNCLSVEDQRLIEALVQSR
jgi:hypothetical protein